MNVLASKPKQVWCPVVLGITPQTDKTIETLCAKKPPPVLLTLI